MIKTSFILALPALAGCMKVKTFEPKIDSTQVQELFPDINRAVNMGMQHIPTPYTIVAFLAV